MAQATLPSGQPESGGRRRIRPLFIIIGLIVLVVVGLLVYDTLLLLTGGGGLIYTVGDAVLNFLFYPNQRLDPARVIVCRENSACSTVHAFVYSALLLFVVITGFAYTTLLERRFIAFFQHRVGPNRVGPLGLLQPLADAIKLITKEDITPSSAASYWVWGFAPLIKAAPVLIVLAVIPLGPDLMIPWFDGNTYQIPLSLADPNVGILWLLSITSVGTYGIVLAGWASNNKYAMLGGLRASAQMISYELSLGLCMAVPVMIVGSMNLRDIIAAQANPPVISWFIFQNPIAAAVLFIALLAEVSRAPFDLPEAEQELTAGFMTEYSGMKFALFMMAEYLGMIAISMIVASLFLGGYHLALADQVPILGPLFLIGKVVVALIFMVWIRATLPRIRYDRLMQFGWKVMLPLALVAVAWTAISLVIGDTFKSTIVYGIVSTALFVAIAGGGYLYLRRQGRAQQTDSLDELADDPVVTGERRGIGWAILTFVGALLAIPFALLNFTITQLENIARAGGVDPDNTTTALALKDDQPAKPTTGGD